MADTTRNRRGINMVERRRDDRTARESLETRIALLEANFDSLQRIVTEFMQAEKDSKKEILEKLEEIQDFQKRQRGFIAGSVFTFTILAGGITASVKYLFFNN
jgi:septal ring factor EnvC (AmiA/AmiB activator)